MTYPNARVRKALFRHALFGMLFFCQFAAPVFAQDLEVPRDEEISALVRALHDTQPEVVCGAAKALGELGWVSPEIAEALAGLAGTSANEDIKQAAKTALEAMAPKPLEYGVTLVKRLINSASPEYWHCEYALRFPDTNEEFFLARLCVEKDKERDSGWWSGFDDESLRLKWVQPERLLQVQWGTLSQGHGRFICLSTLLLLKNEAKWREVFRDTIMEAESSGGPTAWDRRDLKFAPTEDPNLLILRTGHDSYNTWTGGGDHALAWSEKNESTGEIWFTQSLSESSLYPCTLAGNRLKIGLGEHRLKLGAASYLVREVAEYYPHGTMGVDERIAELRRLNPQIDDSGICTGEIVLESDIEPYSPSRDHWYTGSGTSDCPCD